MPTCYQLADATVHAMAREILKTHHPELKIGDGEEDNDYLRLCIMFAFGDAGSGEPAVKLHGYPCAAVISIIPYKQRVDKRADAEIIIDQSQWQDFTAPQRRALLDHEITHLELQRDDIGLVKTDDQGRPKLSMRLHDYQVGGFASIAKRYGGDALEVIQAKQMRDAYGDVLEQNGQLFHA